MKRHSLSRKVIRGGNFGSLNCKNETDPFTLKDIVSIPATDLYKDSSGECYDKAQLRQHILHGLERGVQPKWPSGALVRQQISRQVFRDLHIDPNLQRDYTNEFTDRERFIAQYHAQQLQDDFDEDEYNRLNAPPHYNMQALMRQGRVQSPDVRDLVRDHLLPLGMPQQFNHLYDDDDD